MPDKKSLLSALGEFGLIRKLKRTCRGTSPEILKGIGDDSAVITINAKKILVTTDMLLEGIHFDLSSITFFQLGYKTLAVSISDIFAMGGKPKYFLLGMGIPKNFRTSDIEEIYSGIMKIAQRFKIRVIGGDTCASKHGLVLSGTLIGECVRTVMRSGANEADGIFVTGTLGDSAMGLMLLKKLKRKIPVEVRNKKREVRTSRFSLPTSHLKLIKKHLMPEPVPLKNTSHVTSMIDISDGLLIDLSHICDESRVGALIYEDKIPLSKELARTAGILGIDPVTLALTGGEDYVLLFTAPSDMRTKAVKIGKITSHGKFRIDKRGKRLPFEAEGYEHFRRKERVASRENKSLPN